MQQGESFLLGTSSDSLVSAAPAAVVLATPGFFSFFFLTALARIPSETHVAARPSSGIDGGDNDGGGEVNVAFFSSCLFPTVHMYVCIMSTSKSLDSIKLDQKL